MFSEAEARQFAQGWVEAWNSHDLDAVMSHYAAEVVLTSPTAARLLGDPSGRVAGKAAVRSYFERGLEAYTIRVEGKSWQIIAEISMWERRTS